MATVAQVAKASLQRILVQDSETTLQPAEYQDYIFALNNFMEGLEGKGVDLGWTTVANLSDVLTVPAGAIRGIVDNMAVEVVPDYGGEISNALAQNAVDGMKQLYHLGVTVGISYAPSTLPRGSGNTSSSRYDNPFYADLEADVLDGTL